MKIKFLWDIEEEKEEEKFNEIEFQTAYKEMATEMGLSLNPDDPEHFYDYRALYKETGKLEPNETGHFPSKFKLKGHPRMEVAGINTKTGEPIKKEKTSIIKFDWDKPVEPEPTGTTLTMLPPQHKIRSLSLKEEYEKKAKPEIPSYWGISDLTKPVSPEVQQMETLSFKMKELPTRKEQESFCYELLTGKKVDDIFTLPLEERKEALSLMTELQRIAVTTTEKFNEAVGKVGWIGALSIMGIQAISALGKVGIKVKDKLITGKELKKVLARAKENYIPETGKFKANLSDNDYEIIKRLYSYLKRTGLTEQSRRYLENIVQKQGGLKFPQAVNIFGTKLYAGLPADEIVKSIVEAGKVSAEMVKGLDPVKVSQITQQLLNTSPALASEFLKAVEKPEIGIKEGEIYKGKAYRAETHIPEHGAEIIGKMKTAQEKLDYDYGTTGNYVFKEAGKKAEEFGIDLTKVPDEDVVWVAPDIKTAEKYGEAEEYKLPQDTIILARDDEGGFLVLKNSEEYKELAGTIGYPKPEAVMAKEGEESKIDLATPAQIKKAHAIANSKAIISEKGKMKPQYRKIAEIFTGKKSVKDMTPEEAEMFIDQLNRLPEPKYKAGKLVAPSIPRTMKITTLDFFKKKYGEPTPVWLLTDQTYYATKLGIHPLVEPFEKGKMGFDLEFRQSSHLVDKMVNKLNTIAKTSVFARIKSKVKNVPTKAESKMAESINKYEATPAGLSEKEEDVFKYFRNLSKDIWRRENEVREKVDLPPIKYKQAYFRHTADVMAKEMLEGKYPFPQGIKYWGEKMVGKKIFNPMEFHRKLSDDLIDLWSKDIRAVTKAMLWSGLKEIYLAQPAKFLNEQLNAISKDLPEYKNLSPRDQAAYDQTRVMPASTKKWLIDYVNQVLKGQETELDASLNRIVTKSGLKGIFDKVLSPFGRAIGRKPITNIFMLSGRAVISGVMGWVPRQIMRNSFQPVQNLALYGIKATIKAYLPASVDKNLKELMSESLFLKSYTGFEELPTNLMGKLEKVWLGPYGIVAVNNAKLGMKAAYWNIIELIRNPKFKKHGWVDPQRTKDTPKGFLYPSEKEKLLREMEFGASATQYQYIPMGMPGVFRYKALVPLTRLQSWWMNYFSKFTREAIHRALRGRPSWSGEDGPTLPWSRRVNWLKYVIIGGAILTSLGYKKSFMLGVLPVYMSPAMQVALGMYNYATADEDWKRKKALKQIYYSWRAFIPGSLAWRDFLAVWKGEKELGEILWYGKKEKAKGKPVPTVKFDWDKTTKPKNIIKFNW